MGRAVRLLGEFAVSMAHFDGVAVLRTQLADLCRYVSGWLLPAACRHSEQTRSAVIKSLGQLPLFIEAFASVVEQAAACQV